jgi:hypothetical protein
MTIKANCQAESDSVRELTQADGNADRVYTVVAMTDERRGRRYAFRRGDSWHARTGRST